MPVSCAGAADRRAELIQESEIMKKRKMAALILAVSFLLPVMCEKASSAMTVTSYYDYDFDQKGDNNTLWTNKGNDNYAIKQNANTLNNGEKQMLAKDYIRGNKALKVTLPKNTNTGGLYRIGQEGVQITIPESTPLWYEMSFMCDEAFLSFTMSSANYPFAITSSGELYLGGMKNSGFQNGSLVQNAMLELGKWYHLVVCVDSVDISRSGYPKLYAWLNGEMLTTMSAGEGCSHIWSNINPLVPISDMKDLRLQFSPNADATGSFWLDNFKIYTTDGPVQIAEGTLCFDPMAIFDGAELTSDSVRIENNTIYAPAGETLGSLSLHLNAGKNGLGFHNGKKAVNDDMLTTTPAVGATVYARSDSGIGVKGYTVAAGSYLFDRTEGGAALQKEDGTVVTPAQLAENDSITATIPFVNDTREEETAVIITAAYDGTMLLDYSLQKIVIPVGGGIFSGAPLLVPQAENLNVKAFIWSGEDDHTPLLSRIEWK